MANGRHRAPSRVPGRSTAGTAPMLMAGAAVFAVAAGAAVHGQGPSVANDAEPAVMVAPLTVSAAQPAALRDALSDGRAEAQDRAGRATLRPRLTGASPGADADRHAVAAEARAEAAAKNARVQAAAVRAAAAEAAAAKAEARATAKAIARATASAKAREAVANRARAVAESEARRVIAATARAQALVRGAVGAVQLPVDAYTLTAGFGDAGALWQHDHTGLDFACPAGTFVRAVADGTVVSAGWAGAYGWRTIVRHADGTETWYAHQFAQLVRSGQVKAGQILGVVGSTGNATGPHLHLEVRVDGHAVDPATWLAAHGVTP